MLQPTKITLCAVCVCAVCVCAVCVINEVQVRVSMVMDFNSK